MIKSKLSFVLFFVVYIVLFIGLFLLAVLTKNASKNILLAIVAFFAIFTPIAFSMLYYRYRKKVQSKQYTISKYSLSNPQEIKNNLDSYKNAKKVNTDFGFIYTFIEDKVAYKVVLVVSDKFYFSSTKEIKTGNNFSKAKFLINYEIFFNPEKQTKNKLIDFNFSLDKMYLRGMYLEEDNLVCPNYIKPTKYEDAIVHLESILGIIKE